MTPILREDGEESRVRLAELDDDLRAGRVSHEAELQWGPWTGDAFAPVDEIDALRDALGAPGARLARRLRTAPLPVAALALSAAVLLAGLCQAALAYLGRTEPWAYDLAEAWVAWGAVGAAPTLLDGHWWSAWSSQLTHSPTTPLVHVALNIPLVVYCGWRVDKALGPWGVLGVATGAVAGGAALVVAFSDAPVVGSSILAYGLWAAQIAIGFKFGEATPEGWRGRYGWGNLKFFAPLYAANLFATDVSHLGHLGGILGGAAAVLVLPQVTPAGPDARRRRVFGLALASAALVVLPALASLVLPFAPRVATAPWTRVPVEDQGLSVALPARMAGHRVALGGLRGWRMSPNDDSALFLELRVLREARDLKADAVRDWWRTRLDTQLADAAPPAPLGPGWRPLAFVSPDHRVVEHRLRRGRWVVRAGYALDGDGGARPRLFDAILATIVVAPPPALIEAREKHARNPTHPATTWDLAAALVKVGDVAEAESLLAELTDRPDGWAWDAARVRLELRRAHPSVGVDDDLDWADRFLAEAPPADREIHVPATELLVARGACARARAHVDRVLAQHPDAPSRLRQDLSAAVAGCPEASP
jgi:rhomboid protease GluP